MPTFASRLLPLLLGALLVAGCSGNGELSKEEYEEKVRSSYAEVQEAFQRTNVRSRDELPARVEEAQDALREAADELGEIEPPADAAAEHAQIVDGMRAYAEDLERLRNAAERGDQETIDDFNARIATNRSVVLIASAAEQMKFKGYDLGPIAEE